MNRLPRSEAPPAKACPAYAAACTALAWGEHVGAADAAHLAECPRCTAALAKERALARACARLREAPPPRVRQGLAAEVLAATTRSTPEPSRRWAWGAGVAAAAVAGLAAVTWWRRSGPAGDAPPDFAAVDLELLEELDLAENLDLLEILDALEELDDV